MINENCPCKKKKCDRHGKCDECRKHHAESKRQMPVACERRKQGIGKLLGRLAGVDTPNRGKPPCPAAADIFDILERRKVKAKSKKEEPPEQIP